jgi:ATP-dependent DNA helicase PIF1
MIVDEISMCRMDLFDYLSLTLKKAALIRAADGRNKAQLIVVGDFCQLPPVVPAEEKRILDRKYGFDVGGGYPFMGFEWNSWNFEKALLNHN